MDPFVVLGLPPAMDLDAAELERRYLELSRECHPDRHATAPATDQLAVLQRAAALNDAYRVLRDPWRRAEAIVELSAPDLLERSKQLCPTFLMSAMELAEEVAGCAAERAPALRHEVEADVDRYLRGIAAAIEERNWARAATLLHESRYYRKALADLEEKMAR